MAASVAATARTRLRDVSARGAGRDADEPPRAAPAHRSPREGSSAWVLASRCLGRAWGGATPGSHLGRGGVVRFLRGWCRCTSRPRWHPGLLPEM